MKGASPAELEFPSLAGVLPVGPKASRYTPSLSIFPSPGSYSLFPKVLDFACVTEQHHRERMWSRTPTRSVSLHLSLSRFSQLRDAERSVLEAQWLRTLCFQCARHRLSPFLLPLLLSLTMDDAYARPPRPSPPPGAQTHVH